MWFFASVYLSVCLYRATAQKSYLELLGGKECMEKSKIYYLETLEGTKIGPKMRSVYCV